VNPKPNRWTITTELASRIRTWKQAGYRRSPEAEAMDYVEFVCAALGRRIAEPPATDIDVGHKSLIERLEAEKAEDFPSEWKEGLNQGIDNAIVRQHQAERIQNITYPATYEEQLAVVESMMTCYDTPITQAAGYTRDLLRTIIALEKSKAQQRSDGFSYEDKDAPYAFLQRKGTDACFDFHCKCEAHCHWDGYFAYYVQCPHCKATYQMPFNLFPREVTETDGHEPKVLQSDEECEAKPPDPNDSVPK
jgi:hypothetical protein